MGGGGVITVINLLVDFDVRRQQKMDFFTGGRVIMDSYFSRKQFIEVKAS